jgi:hypothetical protein
MASDTIADAMKACGEAIAVHVDGRTLDEILTLITAYGDARAAGDEYTRAAVAYAEAEDRVRLACNAVGVAIHGGSDIAGMLASERDKQTAIADRETAWRAFLEARAASVEELAEAMWIRDGHRRAWNIERDIHPTGPRRPAKEAMTITRHLMLTAAGMYVGLFLADVPLDATSVQYQPLTCASDPTHCPWGSDYALSEVNHNVVHIGQGQWFVGVSPQFSDISWLRARTCKGSVCDEWVAEPLLACYQAMPGGCDPTIYHKEP